MPLSLISLKTNKKYFWEIVRIFQDFCYLIASIVSFYFFCSYVLSKVHCYCYSWKTFSHLFLLNSPRYTFIYTTNVKRSLDETDFQKTACSCATVIQKPWAKYTANSTLNLTKARLGLYVVNITRDRKQSFESIISLKKIKVPIQCNGTLTQEKKS